MAKTKTKVETVEDVSVKDDAKVFTYVGGGEDSPRTINFMGLQNFTRGKATEVTHPNLLAKLTDHPTFIEGEIEPEELDAYDATAKTEADKKRLRDKAVNAAYMKKYRTE